MTPEVKALLRRDFLSFARKAIADLEGTKIGNDPYLTYLAAELDQFAKGNTPRMVCNLPPGHLKSLLGTVSLSAWLLAHDPTLKIMVVTHTESLSKAMARKIRGVLQSAWFHEVSATRIKLGHAEITDFGTTSGGGVFVTSFGGRFTGHRADVVIVDDAHDIGDSLEQIESTIECFKTTLMSRLNDRKVGRVLVVGHRVHERDLSAYLLRKKTKKWKHVVLPLIATESQVYKTASWKWHRRAGDILRPNEYDYDDIEELRRDYINPDFELLFQQNIDSKALPAIGAEHFPPISGLLPPGAPVVLSVDAGVKKGRSNAFSVVQAWRVGADRFHLIDQFREQCDFSDLVDAVRRFRKKYTAVAILIERAANGHALISELCRKFPKLGKLVRPIDPDGRSKSARLRAHAETIVAKRICLAADASWHDDYVAEFVEFPHGKFSDQIDATTQFLDRANELARLDPPPQTGRGVSAFNSLGYSPVTVPPATGGGPGVMAGTHSDGRPMTVRPTNVRFADVKVWVAK